jgi:glycerol-3-phosphate O-acyltransferase/dihydroxyacetone phosphate acyltransferase
MSNSQVALKIGRWTLDIGHSLLPFASRAAAFVYYRVTYTGEAVPVAGPVLLVANHPNSLLDPALVAAAARRPVRFLAKAPLFADRKTAWLVKSAGSIPVYRRADDPTQMDRNLDTFRAVHAALAEGAAVGIFPEGLSHSEPALAPLKTGAARIALGAAAITGTAFPIVPVGLVFREKDVFRSAALVVTGKRVAWDDLALRGIEDTDAVRLLTDRIAAALRQVTVNLEQWADRPLVEGAVRIWETEHGAVREPGERVRRLEATTAILAEVRRTEDPAGLDLVRDVTTHCARLERLGLRPGDLAVNVGLTHGLFWGVRRIHLLLPLAILPAAAGFVAFWPPYRATGLVVDRVRLQPDEKSTWKLLVGIALYKLWLLLLVVLGVLWWGLAGGIALLLGIPAVGMLGLTVRERWRGAWSDARRFFLLRSRGELVETLRQTQHELGLRLQALYDRHIGTRETV